jgi:hypothetical protein
VESVVSVSGRSQAGGIAWVYNFILRRSRSRSRSGLAKRI